LIPFGKYSRGAENMLVSDRGISLLASLTPQVNNNTNYPNSNNKARYIIPNNSRNPVRFFKRYIKISIYYTLEPYSLQHCYY
jgi:hypothetical protein